MILKKEEIRLWLRLEADYREEDSVLELLGEMAEVRTVTWLNRRLYDKGVTIPPGDKRGMIITADLRLAMLVLVTHFYENREAAGDNNTLPTAFTALARDYRLTPI